MKFFTKLSFDEFSPDTLKKALSAYKVIHVFRNNHSITSDSLQLDEIYLKTASQAAQLVRFNENTQTGNLLENFWTNIEFLPQNNNQSYKHSNTAQPFHTDYGYFPVELDVSFFYCTQQANYGGATLFVDGNNVIELLKTHQPLLLKYFSENKVYFGRGNEAHSNHVDVVFNVKNPNLPKLNWNFFRLKESENTAETLTNAKMLFDFFHNYIFLAGEYLPLKLQPGEAVFFNDRTILHARHSFLGNRKLMKGALITQNITEKMTQIKQFLAP